MIYWWSLARLNNSIADGVVGIGIVRGVKKINTQIQPLKSGAEFEQNFPRIEQSYNKLCNNRNGFELVYTRY